MSLVTWEPKSTMRMLSCMAIDGMCGGGLTRSRPPDRFSPVTPARASARRKIRQCRSGAGSSTVLPPTIKRLLRRTIWPVRPEPPQRPRVPRHEIAPLRAIFLAEHRAGYIGDTAPGLDELGSAIEQRRLLGEALI